VGGSSGRPQTLAGGDPRRPCTFNHTPVIRGAQIVIEGGQLACYPLRAFIKRGVYSVMKRDRIAYHQQTIEDGGLDP